MRLFAEYRRSPATRASPLARFSFLAMLIISLIGIPTLTACDSNNDATIPTAAPTATPIPTPTVRETSSEDSGSATPPTEGVSLSTPRSGSEELFIRPLGSELIQLDLTAGDTLTVSYLAKSALKGIGISVGEDPVAVEFSILDPLNERLLEVEAMMENSVEAQAELTGTYQMVFSNSFRLLGLIVDVEYTINP